MTDQSRRDFFKHAALLSGAAGLAAGALPDSIRKALAIDPEPGSTFLDAEHVVILMQENRSFDHAYGRLRGVRGYNDPRVMTLPDGNPAWVQTNDAGESYAPFRLNIKDTSATWMGSLPHSWTDQVDARNSGKCDRWLQAKPSGHLAYRDMPLTMGYYDRDDIPFYYELADAFTICDQHFCSSLTGTTPNRLYLWSGTIRAEQNADSHAKVFNSEADYDAEVAWKTFPERLEDLGVSWRIYQNELSVESGLRGEAEAWLSNFTDNPIEFFTQFGVRFHPARQKFLAEQAKVLPAEIAGLRTQLDERKNKGQDVDRLQKRLERMERLLEAAKSETQRFSAESYAKLSDRERAIHEKAFTTNIADPDFREVDEIKYRDGDVERTVKVPKGDVLHQFRSDVQSGKLPTVSWLVAPEAFSDHPGSAWYGAWYIAEVLNILTQSPEVWKKTIFLLTYDENDGYFDHVPPFTCPDPARPETGRVSTGIDASVEYVTLEQQRKTTDAADCRDSSIGLGFRVPLVIASPWSRGGAVCSQVFDHTSPLQLIEKLLSHKLGREVKEDNISQWRRVVCGDLSSSFRPFTGKQEAEVAALDRDQVVEGIHRAKFKGLPAGYKKLSAEEVTAIRDKLANSSLLPQQEPGVRPSSPLPYELSVDGTQADDKFTIRFQAGNQTFGAAAAGSPFLVLARNGKDLAVRSYAVSAGDALEDSWPLADFAGGAYHLTVIGPNGFMREFQGDAKAATVSVRLDTASQAFEGQVSLQVRNDFGRPVSITIHDESYGLPEIQLEVGAGQTASLPLDTTRSQGWYDLSITSANDSAWRHRYAGRVESGQWSISDPAMGGAAR
jgi:phospholipase C